MNPALLESQMKTLEPPADGWKIVNDKAPEAVVEDIVERMRSIDGA
jgi:gluconokinase